MVWILPTFRRPALLRHTLERCRATGMSTPMLILVQGEDDIAEYRAIEKWISPYLDLTWFYLPENLGWAQGVARGLELGGAFVGERDWWGFFYDDLLPRTPMWDRRLLAALEPGHFCSATNNWHVDQWGRITRLHTGILSGDLIRAVGFMTVPKTWACFTDDFWETLGQELGIWTKCQDVVIETVNPRKGDMPWDAASEAGYGNNNERLEADRKIYVQFMNENYAAIRARVRALIGLPPNDPPNIPDALKKGRRRPVIVGNPS